MRQELNKKNLNPKPYFSDLEDLGEGAHAGSEASPVQGRWLIVL